MPFIQVQLRRGTATQWSTANPILASGEVGVEIDTNLIKIGDGTTPWNSLSYVGTLADWNTLQNIPSGLVSSSLQFNTLTTPFTGSFTGSFNGTVTSASYALTASYSANATLPSGIFSSSGQVDYNEIQNKPTTIPTASYVEFNNVVNKPSLISSSAQVTASISGAIITPSLVSESNFEGYAVVAHRYLELYPTDVDVAAGADENSAYFYISGSGNDLWYTHKTDSTVNFDWIEGVLETGILHGGIVGFNGDEVHIASGSGIIVTHGASVGSPPSPTINYVTWPNTTASIDVTNGFVTYLAINANGLVASQSTKFTSLQYHDEIPLGAVGHFNQQAIVAKGNQVNTQYSQFAQLTDFARNFGPIKVGGYGITAQSGSLKFSRAAGDAFIYGGFYTQNPETPSNYQSPSVNTGSFAYVYRTGSAYTVDANNNNFYTTLRPEWYDAGGVTTASLASNEWSIQRVFLEPVSGIHYIYYGQAKYTSLANAVSNILTDPFAEGPATSLFTVFIGYLIMKGDTTNLADTTINDIVSAGLFRNTSAGSVGGGAAAQLLNDLSDVSITSPSNGQALIYSSGNWINGTPLNASTSSYVDFVNIDNKPSLVSSSLQINTGSFSGSITTASFATTASFSTTSSFAISASFAPYGGLRTKAGNVVNTAFVGNPRKATVTFTTAFPNTSYAIAITGEDSRAWSIESKTAGSFVISANSNTALTGTTYWTATAYGET